MVSSVIQGRACPLVPAGTGSVVDELEIRVCRAEGGCPRSLGDVAEAREATLAALRSGEVPAALRGRVDGPFREHHRFKVTLAGCPNQCSQPQIADVGFVARRFPSLEVGACTCCGLCVDACSESALEMSDGGVVLDGERCVGCGSCIAACPVGALVSADEGWGVLVGGRLGRHPRLAAEVDRCVALSEALGRLSAVARACLSAGRACERVGATLDRLARVSPQSALAEREAERRRVEALSGLLSSVASGAQDVEVDPAGGRS